MRKNIHWPDTNSMFKTDNLKSLFWGSFQGHFVYDGFIVWGFSFRLEHSFSVVHINEAYAIATLVATPPSLIPRVVASLRRGCFSSLLTIFISRQNFITTNFFRFRFVSCSPSFSAFFHFYCFAFFSLSSFVCMPSVTLFSPTVVAHFYECLVWLFALLLHCSRTT